MTLGKRIKIARKRFDQKLTQKALGEALGVTPQAVSAWERGKAPEPAKFPDLRRLLRVTYAWLLEGGNEPPPDPDSLDVRVEDKQSELFAERQGRRKSMTAK